LHSCPDAAQATQAAPLVPHWDVVAGLTQVVPLQQPAGQDVASQTQALFLHS
jgi:hypothetical protein